MVSRRFVLFAVTGLFAVSALVPASAGAPSQKKPAGETFSARGKVAGIAGGAETYLTIQIDKYTADADAKTMEEALKTGGAAGFLAALRKAPVAGRVTMGDKTFVVRWARQQTTASGRAISIVTDAPMYFVGAGAPGAKPRAGFDVGVLQLNMDPAGIGQGTMAAAAKVKAAGPDGVDAEDYASEPVKLAISKVIS